MLTFICILLGTFTFIPMASARHWIYKAFEFARFQVFLLQAAAIIYWTFHVQPDALLQLSSGIFLCISALVQCFYFVPYLPFRSRSENRQPHETAFRVMVSNVLMTNDKYERLINQVQKHHPDMLLTLESDTTWQQHLDTLKGYEHAVKVPYQNTYGMHLYSKHRIHSYTVHHLVDNDCPCIEAEIEVKGNRMTVFGFHPKPPSPTEENDSIQRDLAFKKLTELLQKNTQSQLVLGDFNAVAWSRPSRKMTRKTRLMDARKGRGFHATFHADYFFLRFPIDHVLHSKNLRILTLKVLPNIGSDHFPLMADLAFRNAANA